MRMSFTFVLCVGTWCLSGALAQEPEAGPAVEGGSPSAMEKIEAALLETTDLQFVDQPLTEVVEFVAAAQDITVDLDDKALTDSGVDKTQPISFESQGHKLGPTLRRMLRPFDLTFVVRDEVLQITTTAAAESILETRVYPVKDLIKEDCEELTEVVLTSVDPDQWDAAGGMSSIIGYGTCLVVSAPRDTHESLENLLVALRQASTKDALAAAESRQILSYPARGRIAALTQRMQAYVQDMEALRSARRASASDDAAEVVDDIQLVSPTITAPPVPLPATAPGPVALEPAENPDPN